MNEWMKSAVPLGAENSSLPSLDDGQEELEKKNETETATTGQIGNGRIELEHDLVGGSASEGELCCGVGTLIGRGKDWAR